MEYSDVEVCLHYFKGLMMESFQLFALQTTAFRPETASLAERRMPYGDFPDVLTLKKGRALHDAVDQLFGELLAMNPLEVSLEATFEGRALLTDRLVFLRRTRREELEAEVGALRSYALTPLFDFLDLDLLTKYVVDYSIEFSIEDLLG